jgi:hypothetical protein
MLPYNLCIYVGSDYLSHMHAWPFNAQIMGKRIIYHFMCSWRSGSTTHVVAVVINHYDTWETSFIYIKKLDCLLA